MESTEIATRPEVQEVQAEADKALALAESYTVTTAEQYTLAGEALTKIKAAQKRLDETRKGLTRPLDESKRKIMDLFRGPAEKLEKAERTIKRAAIGYQQEQERIRRAEQQKLEEQARKERARLEARAAKAAEAGKAEKAIELEAKAATVVAPVVTREAPKVEGLSTRKVWKFRIVDETALPRSYLMPDEQKIRKVVQAMKGDARIPGVEVYPEDSMAARAGGW